MQFLVRRLWPHSYQGHAGNLAWSRFQHTGREGEWRTSLWADGDTVAAWAWTYDDGTIEICTDPAYPELAAEVLAWSQAAWPGVQRHSVEILQSAGHLSAALLTAGFTPADTSGIVMARLHHNLENLADPVVPGGFTLRHAQPGDEGRWAAVHQSAFAPSRVTEESIGNVWSAWPFEHRFAWLAEAPDGSFGAYVIGWYDEVSRVGEFEPVGVREDLQRQGLGRAVCLAALHAFRAAGAEHAVVYCRADDGYPAPAALYTAIGFEEYDRTETYENRRLAD